MEETNPPRLPLAFSDDSDSQDTVLNKKENSSSSIQWDIFENQEKSDQKTRGDIFSDSNDSTYFPSVDEIFKEILNPKGKTEQLEISDNPMQTQIELPEASGDIVHLPKKINDQLSIVGDKRKASETDDAEKDSPEKKRIKTSSYKENNSRDTIIQKENSLKNCNKQKYFARKTGLKTPEFKFLMKIENDEVREREIEELKSQIDALRTRKIKLQIRQNQLRVLNDKDEDRIEELQNLILEKEIELELERSNNQNSITQRTEIEKKSKDLSKQIDFLKRQVSTLQMSEEESKRQKEQLYQKIAEQNKKITKLNHLFQNKETELQQVQQKNNNVVAEPTKQLNSKKGKDPDLIFFLESDFKGNRDSTRKG